MLNKILLTLLLLSLGSCNCNNGNLAYVPVNMRDKVEMLNAACIGTGDNLLNAAKRQPGAGGISDGVLLKTKQDMPIYRMWNGPEGAYQDEFNTTNRLGVWWSPDHPQGKREDYAKINAICPEYNELEWVSQCTLKAGSIIAVGPTQSVKCKDGTEIPANPSLQIFVGNYPKDVVCEKTLIKTCGEPHKPDYKANASDIYNEVCAK